MARAYKCDVCGSFFEKYDKDRHITKGQTMHHNASFSISLNTGIEHPIDLCPSCYSGLIYFLGYEEVQDEQVETNNSDATDNS